MPAGATAVCEAEERLVLTPPPKAFRADERPIRRRAGPA
jgi:hypothetical protein